MNHHNTTPLTRGLLYVTTIAILAALASANVAVSQLGYHPYALKKVVVYTDADSGSFDVVGPQGQTIATYGLNKPVDARGNQVSCQGGMSCLVGDFTPITTQGTYTIRTSAGEVSAPFTISTRTLPDKAPTLMEYFQATLQQGSAYHLDLHRAQNPPFPIMADGSFILTSDQTSLTLIRMGSAYNRNPDLFSTDRYTITTPGQPDIREYIAVHAEYLGTLQDHDGTPAVAKGWYNTFQCGFDFKPWEERYNDEPNPCMYFDSGSTDLDTAQALLALLEAIPALQDLDGATASATLSRAINTYGYIKDRPFGEEEAGYVGAAAFLLSDYTGDQSYLRDAHAMRGRISPTLDSSGTHGNEFYWEEYLQHKDEILAAGLDYGRPEELFLGKLSYDYKDRAPSISGNGEHVYVTGGDFQHSRAMIIEALLALKAAEHAEGDYLPDIAQNQLYWLTGMNQVQDGDWAGPYKTLSFIQGVGQNPQAFHSRLVPPSFHDPESTMKFQNGEDHIPGWISGAYDSYNDDDRILNHYDELYAWRYTETTDEIVAAAMELFAYLDAHYEGTAPPTTDPISPSDGDDDGGVEGTCYSELEAIPASCEGGTLTADTFDGCRTLTCTGSDGTLVAKACPKPDTGTKTHFELYRQSGSGTRICLGGTCVDGEQTYATSPSYPVCLRDEEPSTGGDETDDEAPPSTCATSISDVPVRCEGPALTIDEHDGSCRLLQCGSGDDHVRVLACDKPDSGEARYFEMYRQSSSGEADICLAGTCLEGWGYKKSDDYPLCSDGTGGDDDEPDGEVSLRIKEWYPQGLSVVLVCEGGSAQRYDWAFGDGHQQTTTSGDVYHTYPAAGSYEARCAIEGQREDTITVTVQ